MSIPKFCRKRDGRIVLFDKKFITDAINKAFEDSREGNPILAKKITETVVETVISAYPHQVPSIEMIQDTVEETLIDYHFTSTAKCYILYRDSKSRERVGV